MNTILKRMSLGMLLTITTGLAMHASADQPAFPKVKVSYSDLDLSRADHAARLYQRLKSAATRVCAPSNERQLSGAALRRACMGQALERAVVAVAAPQLTQYYAAKTGQTPPVAIVAGEL
ncbi:MAG: UrcA family protein [Steroidobacteraceae bacterium]